MNILIRVLAIALFGLWFYAGFAADLNMALGAAVATFASCAILQRWWFIASLLGGSCGTIAMATIELAPQDPTVVFLGPLVILFAFALSYSLSTMGVGEA